MTTQLTLEMALKQHNTFERWLVGPNQELVFLLGQLGQPPVEKGLYIWGPAGSGKTHVLQAHCRDRAEAGKRVMYLPLTGLEPSCLNDMEQLSLLVLDDVDHVFGDRAWEQALCQLYNQLSPMSALIMAATEPVALAGIVLPDLRSRLTSLLAYQLQALDDVDKRTVLKTQALDRGLELSDQVCDYLFNHYSRSLSDQLAILGRLDQASLSHQRRLTIPFVKSVLA